MARSSKPLVRLREQAQVGSIPTRLRHPIKLAKSHKQRLPIRLALLARFFTERRLTALTGRGIRRGESNGSTMTVYFLLLTAHGEGLDCSQHDSRGRPARYFPVTRA